MHASYQVITSPDLQADDLGHGLHRKHPDTLPSTLGQTLELLGLLAKPLANARKAAGLSDWATLLVYKDKLSAVPLVRESHPDISTAQGDPDT